MNYSLKNPPEKLWERFTAWCKANKTSKRNQIIKMIEELLRREDTKNNERIY